MAENRKSYLNEVWPGASATTPGWVWYKTLQESEDGELQSLWSAAYAYTHPTADMNSKFDNNIVADRLEAMAMVERTKEISLLNKKFGGKIPTDTINIYDHNGAKELIQVMNTALQGKEIFKRAKRRLLNNEDDISIAKFIIDYYTNSLIEILQEYLKTDFATDWKKSRKKTQSEVILSFINKSSEQIWKKTFEKIEMSKDLATDEKTNNTYQKIINYIRKNPDIAKILKENFMGEFGEDLEESLKGLSEIDLKNTKLTKGNLKSCIHIKARGSKGGNIQETLASISQSLAISKQNGVSGETHRVGQEQAKADIIIDLGVDYKKIKDSISSESNASKRIKNVDFMEKLANQLEGLGDDNFIIFENAKNYTKTFLESDKQKGFSSGSSISLETYYEIMSKTSQDKSDLAQFVTSLMNTVKDAAAEDNQNELVHILCQDFAYFLFDDVTLLGKYDKNDAQAVHLFLLNDFYFPASVFLSLMARAIRDASHDMEKLARGTISTTGMSKELESKNNQSMEHRWDRERSAALKGVKVGIKFLYGFYDIMKNYI